MSNLDGANDANHGSSSIEDKRTVSPTLLAIEKLQELLSKALTAIADTEKSDPSASIQHTQILLQNIMNWHGVTETQLGQAERIVHDGFRPQEIAFSPDAIVPGTKIYVGPLEPGLFARLFKCGVPHAYRDSYAPRNKMYLAPSLRTGAVNAENFSSIIQPFIEKAPEPEKGEKVHWMEGLENAHARNNQKSITQMMSHPSFIGTVNSRHTSDGERHHFVSLSLDTLGFTGITHDSTRVSEEFTSTLRKLGLALCFPDDLIPIIEAQIKDQLYPHLRMAMEPILLEGVILGKNNTSGHVFDVLRREAVDPQSARVQAGLSTHGWIGHFVFRLGS